MNHPVDLKCEPFDDLDVYIMGLPVDQQAEIERMALEMENLLMANMAKGGVEGLLLKPGRARVVADAG